jgi:hypothetical protein
MFGYNKYVVDSSMQLNAKLHKRHTMLSFYRVREAVAPGILGSFFYQEMSTQLTSCVSIGVIPKSEKD